MPEYKINDRVSFVRSGSFVPNGVTEHRLCRNNTPSADVKCFNYSSCPNDVLTETDVTFRADDSRELSAGRFAGVFLPGHLTPDSSEPSSPSPRTRLST